MHYETGLQRERERERERIKCTRILEQDILQPKLLAHTSCVSGKQIQPAYASKSLSKLARGMESIDQLAIFSTPFQNVLPGK